MGNIRPNPNQPRLQFDEASIGELAASIREVGVLQPVLVRAVGNHFELVAGERRWRAAQLAGLEQIPALVRELGDEAALEQAIVENVHREDLTAIEEAAAYQQLSDDFGMSQEDVARRVGRSRPAVANTLRLLQLPADVQRLVLEHKLGAGHARALLGLQDDGQIRAVAMRAAKQGWSVRQVEQFVHKSRDASGSLPKKRVASPDASALEAEEILAERFDTRVHVEMPAKGRGRIVIEFADVADLARIVAITDPG